MLIMKRRLSLVIAILTAAAFAFSACASGGDTAKLSADQADILKSGDYTLTLKTDDGATVICTEKDGVYAMLEEYADHSVRTVAINGEVYTVNSAVGEPVLMNSGSFALPDYSTLAFSGSYRESGSAVESYGYETTSAAGKIEFIFTGGALKRLRLPINGTVCDAEVVDLKSGADAELLDFTPPKTTLEYHSVAGIKERGVLKVYAQQFSFAWFKEPLERDADGNVTKWGDKWYGWEYEYMYKLAQSLGVDLEIVESEFDPMMQSVADGDADAVMCGVLIENYEDGPYSVTASYNDFESVYFPLITKKDAKLDSYEELKDKTVAVWDRTAHMQSAEAALPDATLTGFDKLDDAVATVLNGQADAALITLSALDTVLDAYDGLEKSGYSVEDIASGKGIFMMKDNTEIEEYFNEKIADFTESGEAQKWYDEALLKANEWGIS